MAHPVSEQVIWVDVHGNATDGRDKAVRGELLVTLSDGTVRSTIFEPVDEKIDPES